MKKKLLSFLLLFSLLINPVMAAEELLYNENSVDIQAVETSQESKYTDYAKMYVGEDKYEKFNRKIFNINNKLNKFVARPVHILWSSIMPKCGMNGIRNAYNNIEYPKRLASCIIQRDGKGIKTETMRFLTNTTLGLGGLFDPADKIFKIKPTNENMEQALCKCKVGSGSYLVMPCLNSCTPRSLCGRVLEAALDPSVYIATPITTLVKFGLMVNRTSYMQPLAHLIETTYADPYDIHKKLFGMENYIRNENLDREDLVNIEKELIEEGDSKLAEKMIEGLGEGNDLSGAAANITQDNLSDILPLGKNAAKEISEDIKPDIILKDYKPQCPIVDSMRTAFFDKPEVDKSIWNELSVWNRCFSKRIKSGAVNIAENKPDYHFKYILQKDKTAPIVIFYPSIGEGAGNHHSVIFAKLFYDAGYSVIMQGSHFNWEFVKSMPDGYFPGMPNKDCLYVKQVSMKILENLNEKYGIQPQFKTVVGTSFGAMASLFLAESESKENTLGIKNYIAISPPIDLVYALEQVDKNGDELDNSSENVKRKTAVTAAKILQLLELKDSVKNFNLETLPFSEEEGKLITTFILRQKLSDLIFTLEKAPKDKKSDIYKMVNNMNYKDYAEKYLLDGKTLNDIEYETSLYSIANYLNTHDNYKIYHSLDDYFVNKNQIAKLKQITGKQMTCLNCGAHLGYLYRKEFENSLINDISLN